MLPTVGCIWINQSTFKGLIRICTGPDPELVSYTGGTSPPRGGLVPTQHEWLEPTQPRRSACMEWSRGVHLATSRWPCSAYGAWGPPRHLEVALFSLSWNLVDARSACMEWMAD
ncbi:hypothetical protein V6N12_040311 [Hibiscus sabdariffa]|uniref:Uncharacterized protein n=1 Tax=Hibiscus sabdariffa TaxID=183260 RepID=A0ABR2E3Q6_9ROSI